MSTINLNNPPATFVKVAPNTSDNYSPQGTLFLVNPTSNITISGFTARSNGFLLSFTNISNFTVNFLHQSTSSGSFNRIILPGNSPTSFPLLPGNTVQFRYDGFDRVWRVWGDTGFAAQTISTNVTVSSTGNRQCVVRGPLNNNSQPNFLSSSGFNVSIVPGSEPVVISFADGFNNGAAIDRYSSITNTVTNAWTLPPRTVAFLYADRDISTGSLSYGWSRVEPSYSRRFKTSRNALLHFDGSNGSTAIVDDYGNTWTNVGSAPLSNANPRFGSTALSLNGTTQYISTQNLEPVCQEWSVEAQIRPNNIVGVFPIFRQMLYSGGVFGTIQIQLNPGGVLALYVSTDNGTWNVVNGLSTPAGRIPTNTYSSIRVDYNGSNYRIFVNGVEEANAASNIRHATAGYQDFPCTTWIGYSPTGLFFNGTIDELRITTRGSRGQNNYTTPTIPYVQDIDWFDTNNYRMFTGGPTNGWTPIQRVYLGEAITNDVGVISLVNYAYNGATETEWFQSVSGGIYNVSHNISCDNQEAQFTTNIWMSADPHFTHVAKMDSMYVPNLYHGFLHGIGTQKPRRNNITLNQFHYLGVVCNASSVTSVINGYAKVLFKRNW